MPVPFGFSVGDFAAVIGLLKDLAVALKQNGGASSDYQITIEDLEKIEAILAHLKKLKTTDECLQLVNAIRGQAHHVQRKVQQFLADTEKYKTTLGAQAPKAFYHGSLAKIKWAQHVSIKSKALREDVAVQMNNIQILLDLLLQSEQNQHRALVGTALTNVAGSVDRISYDVKDIPDKIKSDLDIVRAQSSRAFQSLHKGYSEASTTLGERICSNNQQSFEKVAALVTGNGLAELAISRRIHEEMATAKDVQELRQLLNSHLRHREADSRLSKTSESSARFMFVLAIPQMNLPARDVKALLSHFGAELEVLVRFSIATLLLSLKQIVFVIPQLVLIGKVMNGLPPAISLVLNDNLRFTDALGRFHSLQFQQNRHWRVFEATLKCSFERVPGQQMVAAGQFILTSSKYPGQTLNARNWADHARPGLNIAMSISLKTIRAERGHCPRGCGSHTTIVSYTDFECCRCGLIFSARRPKQAPGGATRTHRSSKQDIPSTGDSNVRPRQHYRPGRAFEPTTHDQLAVRKDAAEIERQELGLLKRVHLLKHKIETPALKIALVQGGPIAPTAETAHSNQPVSKRASTKAPCKTIQRSAIVEEVSHTNTSLKRAPHPPLAAPDSDYAVASGQQAANSQMSSAPSEMISCLCCSGSWLRSDIDRFFPHLMIPNGPFMCSACGRKFSVVSNLRRHKKVHKGESVSVHSDDEE